MKTTLRRLLSLLQDNPSAYRAEIARLKREEPERFSALIDCMRDEVSRANEKEDRPPTTQEISEVIEATAAELGWSRARVIAEGAFRVRAAMRDPDQTFTAITPEEDPQKRSSAYERRRSSMTALLAGEVRKVVEKHARASAGRTSPGRYHGR